MSSQVKSPSIAIVGGGPGGLMLARLLELQGIDYVVYERDQSETSNRAGGSLDIHARTGQMALRKGGLIQEFLKHARFEDTAVSLANRSGRTLIRTGSEEASPEIDRSALRQTLLDAIPKGKIKWNHALRSTTLGADKKPLLAFSNGTEASGFDLVVGADGAWSKVRSLVTKARPEYTGKIYIESRIDQDNDHYDVTAKMAGAGLYMAIEDGTPIVIQRQGDRSYRLYFGLQVPETYFRNGTVDPRDTEAVRRRLLTQIYNDWAQEYKEMIRHTNSFRAWTLYTLRSEDVSWESLPGVTLIGDAAHLAYPGGSGVNLALTDALKLFSKIVEHSGDNLARAVHEYESDMFLRGVKAIDEGNGMAELMFGQTPQAFLQVLGGGEETEG